MDDPNMHAYEDQYMDTTDLILRSVCETDPADPDLKDTVCIGISDLKAILDLHLLATSKPETKPAQQDAVDATIPLDKEELAQLIASMLYGTYHCTRVWEAWNVGTMSRDDFEPVDESETPTEIADAIIAAIRAAISAKKGGAV